MKKEPSFNKKNPTAIGLFAGCGGLDLGFKLAGFDIIYANDNEASVKETYEANLGPIEIKDIRLVDKKKLPNADVILAGIPCQPFSNAGNRGSMNDLRGNLFNEVIKILKEKKPKIVIFENVRGFLSSKDDKGIPMTQRIEKDLKRMGYGFYFKLLNAADYEVPQNRYRVVMVGIRKDIDKGFEFPSPVEKKGHLIGNVISKPLPKGESHEVWDLSPQSLKMISHIPEGGSWKNIPEKYLPERLVKIKNDMKKYKSPNFYRRFSREEIMGTVTAAATPENSGILHPLENRRYSVREIARFQSFPESFKFIGMSTSKKYKMIGNAVPVNFAKNLAISLKNQYFK